MRDPQNPKSHLVPDEESAEVVKLIFTLCVGGKGPSQIARELKNRKIYTPAHYYYHREGTKSARLNMDFPYHWRSENIVRILENEVYVGTLVSLMTTTKSYKNKRVVERPKEEQIRFENAHQAIVEKEIWDLVQKLRENKIRPTPLEEPNIFAGLVVCEDCGKKMKLRRGRTIEVHQNNFMCQTHSKRGKEFCTAHYIKESAVKTIVLDDLRRVLHLARNHEMLFSKYLNKKSRSEVQKEIVRVTKELSALKNRDDELRSLFKRLYEDNVLGKIPNEVFRALSQDYLAEQKQVQAAIPLKESELEQLHNSAVGVESFIERAKRYPELPELNAEVLRVFIDKVVIGEKSEKYSRHTFQKVTIYYRDIGLLDLADTKALQAQLGVA